MALFQVGIDVSRYQGSINWSAVAAAGKQFAIVRAGFGSSITQKDADFDRNMWTPIFCKT